MTRSARFPSLLAVLALAAMTVVMAPVTAGAQQEPVVEAARQVTTESNPTRAFVLPQIAVHPDDASVAAMVVADARNGDCGLHVTADGGRSWEKTIPSLLPDDMDFCLDPTSPGTYLDLTFSPDGVLYAAFYAASFEEGFPDGPETGYVLRTEDLGATHEVVVFAEPEPWTYEPDEGPPEEGWLSVRHPRIAVDPEDPDRLYATFRSRGKGVSASFREVPDSTHVVVSEDGGRTWSDSTDLTVLVAEALEEDGLVRSGTGLVEVAGDGTAFVVMSASGTFFAAESSDRGASWQVREIGEGTPGSGGSAVSGVDPDGSHLYVVWHQRVGVDDVEEGEPLPPAHVYMLRSADGGATWDERVNLTAAEAPVGFSQYHPGLAVALDGRVDVAWYDYRHDLSYDPEAEEGSMGTLVSERFWDVYVMSSTDRGATWSPHMRATDRSISAERGVTFANHDVIGSIGVASTEDAILLSWGDTRAGDELLDVEDAYFTQVRLTERAAESDAAGTSGGRLAWAALGAAVALALAGAIMLLLARRHPRGPSPASPTATATST